MSRARRVGHSGVAHPRTGARRPILTRMTLIAAADLLARLGDPHLRLLDVRWSLTDPGRGRRDYVIAHLPGAAWVDLDTELAVHEGPGRHPLPDPIAFAARMAALGVGDDIDVVVYDDAGGTIAARLWWMLDDLGHRRVSVLDGGMAAWIAAGGPLTQAIPVPADASATLHLAARWSRVIDREALVELRCRVALIDARAPERYRGDIEPVDAKPGHIPTAISLPTAGNLAADGRFLGAAALRERFEDLGPEVVTSCGSGVTACHNALAMRVAGLTAPLLYEGSYSDWARTGMPVATGDEPGTTAG
jgi:thiosulfate/3-mercaptopyruvate sulfurtransferase